jgi:hypothetical protein
MSDVRWTVFPTKNAKCFGCGRLLRKSAHWKQVQKGNGLAGDPHFIFSGKNETIHVCPICAMLCAMKTNNHNIREGEFNDRTMANINRKHKKEIIARHLAGESYYSMLQEMFPAAVKGNKMEKKQKETKWKRSNLIQLTSSQQQ